MLFTMKYLVLVSMVESSTSFTSNKSSSSESNNADPNIQGKDFSLLTLDEWLNKFGRIYGKRHEKDTTEYMISRLVEEVAELVNPMESQDRAEIAPNLADVFSWICSIAHKLSIDLSQLAWKKYGENAPRPSWSKSRDPSLVDYSVPATLREWQEFISKLYQNENSRITPMNALVAMMKDVGDLAMLHRKRASQEQITSKIAAILAWTLTIAQLLKLDLAEVVFSKYDDHCPMCLEPICNTDICHPLTTLYASFGNSSSDEEKYVILDTSSKFGLKVLVNTPMEGVKDLSTSIDLINESDSAIILLSALEGHSQYRQVFETLFCYSVLSRGNIWVFTLERSTTKDFVEYLASFSGGVITVISYKDPHHLRSLFEKNLDDLFAKRKKLSKAL